MTIETGIYRHFKGKTYRVHGFAVHSETGETMVIYEPMYPSETRIWVRPAKMWNDEVVNDKGEKVPRFKLV